MNAAIRAKRILSQLSGYDSTGMTEHDSDRLHAFASGGAPIGVYLNASECGEEKLLISDIGILVETGADELFIAYEYIEQISIVADGTPIDQDVSKKVEANGLFVRMTDGSRKLIPVRNGDGKYRDVFEFARFLRRVVEDTRKNAYAAS